MTVYAALLRGINVGGKNKLPMTELRAICSDLGHEDVVTYIQSGNVVLTSADAATTVAADLVRAIKARVGLDVPVIVRSRAQLTKVVGSNPFLKEGADPAKLHVTFLADRPTAASIAKLDPDRSPHDRFVVDGREIFMLTPKGLGQSKLTMDYFERRLGTRGTARNWNTVNRLLDLMQR